MIICIICFRTLCHLSHIPYFMSFQKFEYDLLSSSAMKLLSTVFKILTCNTLEDGCRLNADIVRKVCEMVPILDVPLPFSRKNSRYFFKYGSLLFFIFFLNPCVLFSCSLKAGWGTFFLLRTICMFISITGYTNLST